MRIGTVLCDDRVCDESPIKYTIYIGRSGYYYNTLFIYKDRVCYNREHKKCVGIGKSIHPIGKTDVLNKIILLLKTELIKYKEEMKYV